MKCKVTTDKQTLIDYIVTDISDAETESSVLEAYFSDHKAIWVSYNPRTTNAGHDDHYVDD